MASCAPPALKAKLQLEDGDNGRRECGVAVRQAGGGAAARAQLARGFEAMWREASESLATMLGCDAEDEQVVRHWRLVAATLHLGQIDFKKNEQKNSDDTATLADDPASAAAAAAAAALLGCTQEELVKALCTKASCLPPIATPYPDER